MEQLCPKCATGTCPWRDGIMCRNYVCARDDVGKSGEDLLKDLPNYVCARDDVGKSGEDLLKDLPPGFAEIFREFGSNGQSHL